mmetsp:Transcript_1924/g.4502  ORF Transcript_1924/g.4502 Transcript_1924/m.4502 type:complete len:886 (+) Transcript_1924:1666-4323(+)
MKLNNIAFFCPKIMITNLSLNKNISNNKKKFKSIVFSMIDSNSFYINGKFENLIEKFPDENLGGKIISADLHSEMSRSYMEYAMSVIYGRALPDVRDGLKPVHRRILFAMYELGLFPDTPFRKCARIVGEVLGKYHPHGDTAVYDALVRMAQNFSMRTVLVYGHGNFGSIDHDPPAAMRYTECKISKISNEIILKDLGKKTCDFINNFDGSCSEPSVMPSVLPTLLLNGSNGIAVGMATNIPPHNLTEISNSVIALLENPEIEFEKLLRFIPAPDFPTGGSILGLQGCNQLYKTGQGSIVIRGKTHFEIAQNATKSSKISLVITELPYQVNKTTLITKIAEIVNNKYLEGVVDLRDESDRDGIRIVIELKKGINKEIVLNGLFKKTPLQTSFGGNILALVGHQPSVLTIKEILLLFIHFRRQTIKRSLKYQLNNSIEKDHIIKGLLITLKDIDQIINIIRKSKNNFEAKIKLMELGLTQAQSDAILNIQLRRLTKLEADKLFQEHETLDKQTSKLKNYLFDPAKVDEIIKNDLSEINLKFGMPRKTTIIHSVNCGTIEEIEMVLNYRSIVMATRFFIKRMLIETFESQTRGTRGKKGVNVQDNDTISHFFFCKNHDTVLIISSFGIAFSINAFKIPISNRSSKGVPLSSILPNDKISEIATIISIPDFSSDQYLILLTKKGMIKKTPIIAFASVTARGLIVISIKKNDELNWVRRCYSTDSLLISSKKGKALRFLANKSQLRATGRNSKGVKAFKLDLDDKLVDIDVIPNKSIYDEYFILIITSNGYGKRINCQELKIQNRGGKGVLVIKLKKIYSDELISARYCSKLQEVLLSTRNGTVVRQKIDGIPLQNRTAQGVKVQKLVEGDLVSKISIVTDNKEGKIIN